MGLLLAVNPAETQRLVQSLGVSDGSFARIFFEYPQPNALAACMVFLQPIAEVQGRLERQRFHAAARDCAISTRAVTVFQFRTVPIPKRLEPSTGISLDSFEACWKCTHRSPSTIFTRSPRVK